MDVEWIHDPVALWTGDRTSLVDADPDATFFHTPRYLKLYWEEFGARHLHLATVRRGGAAVAAAAFDLMDDHLGWLGGFEVTDYMGPVGLPEHRAGAAAALMASLFGRDDWRTADLAGVPEDSAWLPALEAGARAAGLEVHIERDSVAPFLALPRTWDQYLAGLPGKPRHEIRRKERRLREAMPGVRLVDATPETLPDRLGRFVDLHRSGGGEKGRFMVPGMELFFRRLTEALLDDGTLRLAFLEAGGRSVAGAVGFRFRDRFLLYNSAYDRGAASLSPGTVLVGWLIRAAIEEGRRAVDLLKGEVGYKYRFGARPRRVRRLRLRR